MGKIPLMSPRKKEIEQSHLLKNEKKTFKFDVYCFGLILLEMISSDLDVPHAYKHLCRLINQGKCREIIRMVVDPVLSDFLQNALEENPDKRWSVNELQNHAFF